MRFIDSFLNLFVKPKTYTTVEHINGGMPIYPKFDSKHNAVRYCTNDDVFSVIRLLASTAATIPFYPYKIANKQQKRKLQDLSYKAAPFLHEALKTKALKEMDENSNLFKLLENPSKIWGKYEFYEAIYTTLFLQGELFLWKELKEFGANKGEIEELHFLYPQFVVIKINEAYPFEVISYDYIVDGIIAMQNIPKEEIIHIKYFNPNYSIYGNNYRGHSPLQSLGKTLTRMDNGMDASVAQMQNGGIPGVLFEKGANFDKAAIETVGQRRNNFLKYLKESENKGSPYFAAGDMGYIQLGLKLADLEVAELAKIDFKKLCNAFGVSDVLFNNGDSSTESNVEQMFKRLYTNSILPNVQRIRDALNKGVSPHYSTNGEVFINYDLSGVQELQDNMKDLVAAMKEAWWILPNEKREAMNYGKYEDPIFDAPLIPTSLTTLEDMEFNKIIPTNGEYSSNNSQDD